MNTDKQKGDLLATLTGKTHTIKVKVVSNRQNLYEVYTNDGEKLSKPTIIYGTKYTFWTDDLKGFIHQYSLTAQPELFT